MTSKHEDDLILLGDLAEAYANLNHAVSDASRTQFGLSSAEAASRSASHSAIANARDLAFQNLVLHSENLTLSQINILT